MHRRFPPVLALLSVLALALPAVAAAQDCGEWRDPVLCRAELQISRDGGRWERVDDDEIDLAPDERVELRVAGDDQWGRDFRSDRLMLGIDDRDCGSVVEIDDRGEGELVVQAEAREDRCRLELWVPGNLNFEWDLVVSVTPEARSGYTRSEAEFVAEALYRSILGREPDPTGLAGAVAEIERGRLDSQVEAMVRSQEFRSSAQGAGAEALMERFYQGLLGRSPTSDEILDATDALRRGLVDRVILAIVRSAEFEERLANR